MRKKKEREREREREEKDERQRVRATYPRHVHNGSCKKVVESTSLIAFIWMCMQVCRPRRTNKSMNLAKKLPESNAGLQDLLGPQKTLTHLTDEFSYYFLPVQTGPAVCFFPQY